MTTPEAPKIEYPYHPEVWRDEIDALTKTALASELELIPIKDAATSTDIAVGHLWRVPMYGFRARLDQPVGEADENTTYRLSFEDDVPGQRYFGRSPFVALGLRYPVSGDQRRIRKYGIFEYSIAQGFTNEPEGNLPFDWKESGQRVGDITDIEKRVTAFENLVKILLRFASKPQKAPIMPPRYGHR